MGENEIRVSSAAGRAGRVIAARILPGGDFLEGIEKICRDNGVRYATVVCCIGSLQKATFCILAPMDERKIGFGYGEPFVVEGPVEILSAQGLVCEGEDGGVDIHLHAVLCDKKGSVIGGHVVPGGNPTLATIDLVLTEVVDARLMRRYDPETELTMFTPLGGR